MAEDSYGSSKALLNEAGYIIKRLDVLQNRINTVRMNPLAWNNEMGTYNYLIWFADLNSLLHETWAKLDDNEQKELESVRILIHNSLKLIPPHKVVSKASDSKKSIRLAERNWESIEQVILIFEKKIKTALDDHGLANPDMDDGDLF